MAHKYTNSTVKVSLDPTLVLVGCHTRWDVGTKSRVVKKILETTYPAKATTKEKYEAIAAEYNVTYQTIHNWVKDFGHTCTTTQFALDGTLVWSPTVIQGKEKIANTVLELKKIQKALNKLYENVETAPYSTRSAKEERNKRTSVQQELSDAAIKKD